MSSSLSLQIVHLRGGAAAVTLSPVVVVVVVAGTPLAVVVGFDSPSTDTPDAGRAEDGAFLPTKRKRINYILLHFVRKIKIQFQRINHYYQH